VEDLIDRGTTLRASGDSAAALALFAEAVQRAPHSVDAWIHYGLALADRKQPEEALTAFTRALAIDPTSEPALLSQGDLFFVLGRYSEAVAAYDRALERNRTYVTAWYNRGTALLALKQYEQAAENYLTVQRLDPRNSDAYMFQADALWQVGRRREAIGAYARAIELKPGSLGDLTRPIRTLIRRYQ
jgi:tetratricopeptide (TPR) repeat protein